MSREPSELPDDASSELDDSFSGDEPETDEAAQSFDTPSRNNRSELNNCELRRKIEDRLEEKRLRDELGDDFDYYDDLDD